jgi:hypothetical protein
MHQIDRVMKTLCHAADISDQPDNDGQWTHLLDAIWKMRCDVDILRRTLEEVEWTNSVDGRSICPWCVNFKHEGHHIDCPRQFALGKESK